MKKTFTFTKKNLEKITPTDRRETYSDIKANGLKLIVQKTGVKSFVLYRRIDGRPERILIGRFPDMTIEQARKNIAELNAQIANGLNPKESQRVQQKEWTLVELFSLFIDSYAKQHKKTWKKDVHQYNLYLKDWAYTNSRLSLIKKIDIQKLHVKLGEERGKHTANRLLSLLKTLFNKAIVWGWEHPNPTNTIPKYKEESRERFLQEDELERFFDAVAKESSDIIRDYIYISLLTGARRSNVQAMHWDEISFERATWSIAKTKNGTSQTIPLIDAVLNILRERKKNSSSDFVFPGPGKKGHLAEPKKGWARILKMAGIKDLRLHDLRRSLGSWQASTGANLSVIGKTLNHKDVRATAIYARLNIDPVREAIDKAANAIFAAAGIQDSNELSQGDNLTPQE